MKKMNSLLNKGFQAAKCKTQLRLGTSRIKLLRNKKGIKIAADRREVAEFLRNGQENNARLRVEHVIREQNLIEAYDLLYLYAERIAGEISVIDSQKICPTNLKEDISTLLYASSRCSELGDFAQIRPMFVSKYGKEFVSAAEELRPGCGVNGRVIEKLSASLATGQAKLKAMKQIATEHNVQWDPAPFEREIRVVPEDLLDGPTVFMSAETLPTTIDVFPSVPNHEPTLGTRSSSLSSTSQPDTFTTSSSGKYMEDKLEPVDMPPPVDDYRTVSQGSVRRSGPPSRDPPSRNLPGRNQSRTEELSFDNDMEPGRRETQSRRNPRRESDILPGRSQQARYQGEESRRNSIGVPREMNDRAHTGSAYLEMGESLSHEYKKHNRRVSQGAEIDDFDETSHSKGTHEKEYHTGSDGSHRSDRRQRQFAGTGQVREADTDQPCTRNSRLARAPDEEFIHTSEDDERAFAKTRPGSDGTKRKQTRKDQDYEGGNRGRVPSREGSGKARSHNHNQCFEEDNLSRSSSGEGSGRTRPQHQDRYFEEDNLRTASSREGSGKARPQHQDQYFEEDGLRRVSSREGSGKARPQYQDQYFEEDNLRRSSSKEGSRNKIYNVQETSAEEGTHGRIGGRRREGKQYARNYQGHDDYGDEEADHVPHQPVEPRRRDSTNITPKYVDEDNRKPEWHIESFGKSVTTRIPRNSENSGNSSRRVSPNRRAGGSSQDEFSPHVMEVDDVMRKSSNLSRVKPQTYDAPRYASSEEEYDFQGNAAGKPESRSNNFRTIKTRNSDRSSESGEEESRKGTRRTHGLSSVDKLRKGTRLFNDPGDTDVPLKASKSTKSRSDSQDFPRTTKASRHPKYDNEQEDFDDDHFTTSSRTMNDFSHTERRMSLPGGVVREKAEFQANRPDDDDANTERSPDFSHMERRMSLPGGGVREKAKSRANRPADDDADTERRRMTIGPVEIRAARDRESVDTPRRGKYGEEEQQLDTRRQSAPILKVVLPRDDITEGRQSPNYSSRRYSADRYRKSDSPVRYDDDRPPRFLNPKVGLQDLGDEYSPNTSAQRVRSDRQRKSDSLARYDFDRPPRFITVGKPSVLDDEDSPSGRSSPGFRGEKPQRFVNSPRGNDELAQPTPRARFKLASVKTDPDLSGSPRVSTPEHRKTRSAFADSASRAAGGPTSRLHLQSSEETMSPKQDGQLQSTPVYMKPPDLDVLIQMFGKKK